MVVEKEERVMDEEEDGSGNQCETGLDREIEYGKKMVV